MKTALVTGGSRGIGAATVRALTNAGWQVAFLYCKSEEQAAELAQKTGAVAILCDVSVKREVADAVEQVLRLFSHIDLVVNNAAVSNGQQLICDVTEMDWQRMLAVNVSGVFYVTQCVLPSMIARHSGHIINISSVWGLVGASCEVDYSTCKAAVIGMTKALAKEVAPSGILVNCLAPGVVDTEMNAHLSEKDKQALCDEIPLGRMASADEIAAAVVAMAHNTYTTGQVISPNGGFVI